MGGKEWMRGDREEWMGVGGGGRYGCDSAIL